jgi:glycine cleavage system transcriptional repressor
MVGMHTNVILTLTGPDRVGLVEDVTGRILDHGGNIETSRMARLGGAFAILSLISLSTAQLAGLEAAFESLIAQGYKLTLSQAGQAHSKQYAGWLPYQIEVHGADHEGIIHHVAHVLAESGITIESMDTSTASAAMSGSPLFSMRALVLAPPELPRERWESALQQAGHDMNVDIVVSAAHMPEAR